MKWVYIDKKTKEVLDSWGGDVYSVLDHVNIGDGIWSLAMNGYWEDDNVMVYQEDFGKKPDCIKGGVCRCDSRDLFWYGCRCGFMKKA